MGFREIYESFEDKYYDVLDKIDAVVPIYKIIDSIDKIVPSFILVLLILLLLFFLLIFSVGGAIFGGTTAEFLVLDSKGESVSGIGVSITFDDGPPETFRTDAFGEFSINVKSDSVLVEIDVEDYDPYSKQITVSVERTNEIVLQRTASLSGFVERIINIKDISGNQLNGASIRFSCSSNAPSPQTKINAKPTEKIAVTSECGTVTATVNLAGFEEKKRALTSLTTNIVLTPVALEAIAGSLKVVVKDSETFETISEIEIKLYTEDNFTVETAQTDGVGSHVFTVAPGNYYVRAFDLVAPVLYSTVKSDNVIVSSDHTTLLPIELTRTSDADLRKVFVEIVDEGTGAPIEGAEIVLFDEDAVIFFLNSDTLGQATFFGLDNDSSYFVSVAHNDYIFQVPLDIEAIETHITEATEIELTKALPPEVYADVIVNVITLQGNVIDNAQVRLIDDSTNDAIRFGSTNDDGEIIFDNMPVGDYRAKAISLGFEGESEVGSLTSTDFVLLEVVLVLQQGAVEVEVVHHDGSPFPGAEVKFVDSIEGEVLENVATDLDGKTGEISFLWSIKPYIVVSFDGYLTRQTADLDLIPEDTIDVKVILSTNDELETSKCDSDNELCINLIGIKNDSGQTVNTIKDNSTYSLIFNVIATEDLEDVKVAIRTGLEENETASDSLIIIEDVSSQFNGVKFSEFDNSDQFDTNFTQTQGDGKHMVIFMDDLSGGVEYELEVEIFIKDTDVAFAPIEIRYSAIGELETDSGGADAGGLDAKTIILPGLDDWFLESLSLGNIVPCVATKLDCANFVFLTSIFPLSSPDDVILLEENEFYDLTFEETYQLNYTIFNLHEDELDFSDVVLNFVTDNAGIVLSSDFIDDLDLDYGIENGISGDIILKPDIEDSATQLTLSLDLDEEDVNVTFSFEILPVNNLTVEIIPNSMVAGTPNVLLVQITDHEGEFVDDAIVQWDDTDPFEGGVTQLFAAGIPGAYTATILGRNVGESIFVQATKTFFTDSDIIEVPVTDSGFIDFFSGDFDCVSLSEVQLMYQYGDSTNFFELTTEDCIEKVQISLFVPSASATEPDPERAGPIKLYDQGGIELSPSVTTPVGIMDEDNALFRVYTGGSKLMGIYDVQIRLRYEGQSEFHPYAIVETIILPNSASNFELKDDGRYGFDLFDDGSAIGQIENLETVEGGILDFWAPRVSFSLDAAGQYHVEQARFVDLDNVDFTWTIVATVVDGDGGEHVIDSGGSYTIVPTHDDVHTIGTFEELPALQELVNDGSVNCVIYLPPPVDDEDYTGPPECEEGEDPNIATVFFEIEVTNTSGGFVSTWLDGELTEGFVVKARYIGDPEIDYSQPIDFEVIRDDFAGVDYSILEVRDYINIENAEEYDTFHFDFVINDKSFQEFEIAADAVEYSLGTINGVGEGPDWNISPNDDEPKYAIDTVDNLMVLIYFKDSTGQIIFETNDESRLEVFAKTAFTYNRTSLVDLAFLIDTSGSMNSTWGTICAATTQIVSSIEGQGYTLNHKIYGMKEKRSCAGDGAPWGDELPLARSTDEAWAATGQWVIDNFDWTPGARRLLLVIGDNDPSGQGSWLTYDQESQLVVRYVDKAIANQVSLFFLYRSSMEATQSTMLLGSTPVLPGLPGDWTWTTANDSRELMSYAAMRTGGTARQYSPTPDDLTGLGVQSFVNLVQRSTNLPVSEYFHVKIESGADNICYGVNDVIGYTGPSVVPDLLPSWDWDDIGIDTCDKREFGSVELNDDFVYCDAAQFTTEILKKISRYQTSINEEDPEDLSEVLNNIILFKAYLIRDGYTPDFLNDYGDWMDSGLFTFPAEYSAEGTGLKHLFRDNNINFETYTTNNTLGETGLYDVQIIPTWGESGEYVFFEDEGKTNVSFLITMNSIENLDSENLLYYIPIDGSIGQIPTTTTIHRDGYGVGFEGEPEALALYVVEESGLLNVTGTDVDVLAVINTIKLTDFETLNHLPSRGNILEITNTSGNNYDFIFTPSRPTPVVMKATNSVFDSSKVDAFIDLFDNTVQVTNTSYLTSWDMLATDLPFCRDFEGNRFFNRSPDMSVENSDSDTCETDTPNKSFGFHWDDAPEGVFYMKTIFYTRDDDYAITNACSATDLKLVSPNAEVNSGIVNLFLNSEVPNILTLENVFELVNDEYVCISNTGNKTSFWWNQDKIYDDFREAKPAFFSSLPTC